MVGVKGFEPSTPCTPCKCATRLRHTPRGQIISALSLSLPDGTHRAEVQATFLGGNFGFRAAVFGFDRAAQFFVEIRMLVLQKIEHFKVFPFHS